MERTGKCTGRFACKFIATRIDPGLICFPSFLLRSRKWHRHTVISVKSGCSSPAPTPSGVALHLGSVRNGCPTPPPPSLPPSSPSYMAPHATSVKCGCPPPSPAAPPHPIPKFGGKLTSHAVATSSDSSLVCFQQLPIAVKHEGMHRGAAMHGCNLQLLHSLHWLDDAPLSCQLSQPCRVPSDIGWPTTTDLLWCERLLCMWAHASSCAGRQQASNTRHVVYTRLM